MIGTRHDKKLLEFDTTTLPIHFNCKVYEMIDAFTRQIPIFTPSHVGDVMNIKEHVKRTCELSKVRFINFFLLFMNYSKDGISNTCGPSV